MSTPWTRARSITTGTEPGARGDVESGDVVHFDLPITGKGQVTESLEGGRSGLGLRHDLQPRGPIYIAGASRGDTLEVEILELNRAAGDGRRDPRVRSARRRTSRKRSSRSSTSEGWNDGDCRTRRRGAACEPFLGTMGVPTDEPGRSARSLRTGGRAMSTAATSSQARRCGCRSGARARSSLAGTLTVPRGTGKSASAGIECPMQATLRFRVSSARTIPDPRSSAPRGREPGPYQGTMGIHAGAHGRGPHRGSLHDHWLAEERASAARTPTSSAASPGIFASSRSSTQAFGTSA